MAKVEEKQQEATEEVAKVDLSEDKKEEVVEEGFRLPREMKEMGAKVRYEWVNEVWEGTRIYGRFYININTLSNQRTSLDNPYSCKLFEDHWKQQSNSKIHDFNISRQDLGT